MVATAIIAGAAISAGSGLLSGIFGSSASSKAASEQAQAEEYAAQLQYQMYQQTAARLQPWTDLGTAASQQLGGLLGLSGYSASGAGGYGTGSLMGNFQPTMQQLSQTPGYQFALGQGEAATQNAASATGTGGGVLPGGGLAVSGPEGKSLTSYAEGLASTTYQQQFQNYWTQLSNIYNMLSGTSAQGANAAALTGQSGTAAATAAGNFISSAGASTAAGTIGSANAINNALSNVGNVATSAGFTQALINSQNQGTQLAQTNTNNALNAGGSPSAFQASYGLGQNQYVP